MSANSGDEGRSPGLLRGWKDVAGYLGVSVRTAQRLAEQAGLPVHRTGHLKGGLSASQEALDAWVRERGETRRIETSDAAPPAPTVRVHFSGRRSLAAAGLGLAVLFGLVALVSWSLSGNAESRAAAGGESPSAAVRKDSVDTPRTFRLQLRGRVPSSG